MMSKFCITAYFIKKADLIFSVFLLLSVSTNFASRLDLPLEYLAQKSDIIIVGEIERMDYDLQYEPPNQEYHYSLAHLKVEEVLKADEEIEEYFTFKVSSKKSSGNSAIIYWDKGDTGAWFFRRINDSDWLSETRKPVKCAADVRRELSYTYQREFAASF